MVYNSGFTGLERLAFCTFPDTPDFYEHVNFPGVGEFNPGGYPCLPSATPVHFGMDGFAHDVWSSDTGSAENPTIYTEFEAQAEGTRQIVTHRFGLAGVAGNGAGGVNQLNGNCDRGVFCAMSGDGSGGNEQGYGLLLKIAELGAYLVQFTNGLKNYNVLTYKRNMWQEGFFTRITLICVIDPLILKGVYLKATAGNELVAECVYAGSFADVPAYIPTGQTLAGPGIVNYSSTVAWHAA